jgi:hypothetical protein
MRNLAARITYANVVATLALFIALGGTAWAAATITSAEVKDRSLIARDIKLASLTGAEVKNGSLAEADLSAAAKASLKGAAGATGPAGPAGANGTNGAVGAAGPTGSAGRDGAVAADEEIGDVRFENVGCDQFELARLPVTLTAPSVIHVNASWFVQEALNNTTELFLPSSALLVPRGDAIDDLTQVETTESGLQLNFPPTPGVVPNPADSGWGGLLGSSALPVPAGSWDIILVVEVTGSCPATNELTVDLYGKLGYVAWRVPA